MHLVMDGFLQVYLVWEFSLHLEYVCRFMPFYKYGTFSVISLEIPLKSYLLSFSDSDAIVH